MFCYIEDLVLFYAMQKIGLDTLLFYQLISTSEKFMFHRNILRETYFYPNFSFFHVLKSCRVALYSKHTSCEIPLWKWTVRFSTLLFLEFGCHMAYRRFFISCLRNFLCRSTICFEGKTLGTWLCSCWKVSKRSFPSPLLGVCHLQLCNRHFQLLQFSC